MAAYVAAVTAHLDDLGPAEIEELTGGLEADLTDELSGQSALPVTVFGAPAAYAAELRSAAGLPPRRARRSRPAFPTDLPTLVTRVQAGRDVIAAPLIAQTWWPPVGGFLIALRPSWWVLRAYVAYQWIDQTLTGAEEILPYGPVTALTLLALVVGSVELGRRNQAGRGPGWRTLIAVGNVFAALLLLFAGTLVSDNSLGYTTEYIEVLPTDGLYNGDYEVVNVFPYDQNGQPLTGVQLFDDRGRPIAPASTKYTGRNGERVRLVPAVTADGESGLNVFPLSERVLRPGYDEDGEPLPAADGSPLRSAAWPDPTQPAVVPIPIPASADLEPTSEPTSTPTATPTPTR